MPILGSTPCCDNHLCVWLENENEVLGKWYKHQCEHCGTWIFTLLSNLSPMSYTEEAFKAEYEIDEATKQIKKRESSEGQVTSVP